MFLAKQGVKTDIINESDIGLLHRLLLLKCLVLLATHNRSN